MEARPCSGVPTIPTTDGGEAVCRLPDLAAEASAGGLSMFWTRTTYLIRRASPFEDRETLVTASLALFRDVLANRGPGEGPVGHLVVFHVVENATRTRLRLSPVQVRHPLRFLPPDLTQTSRLVEAWHLLAALKLQAFAAGGDPGWHESLAQWVGRPVVCVQPLCILAGGAQ
jgi:hypothetical protein